MRNDIIRMDHYVPGCLVLNFIRLVTYNMIWSVHYIFGCSIYIIFFGGEFFFILLY